MPIYEYICDDCSERYERNERIVMNQKQAVTSPKCASAKHTIQLSVFAAPGNGARSSGASSSRESSPKSGSGGGCCGGGCGCH